MGRVMHSELDLTVDLGRFRTCHGRLPQAKRDEIMGNVFENNAYVWITTATVLLVQSSNAFDVNTVSLTTSICVELCGPIPLSSGLWNRVSTRTSGV